MRTTSDAAENGDEDKVEVGGGDEGWVAPRGIQEEVREGEIRRVSRTEGVNPRKNTVRETR